MKIELSKQEITNAITEYLEKRGHKAIEVCYNVSCKIVAATPFYKDYEYSLDNVSVSVEDKTKK
jgi:hypothetical protein